MTSLLDLSQSEIDVLLRLAQARVTASAVTLAADLWRTSDAWNADDLYPLLTYLLDSLSSRGLVKYKVQKGVGLGYGNGRTPDIAYDIRLTREGWALAGYPHLTVAVGSRASTSRRDTSISDLTNFMAHESHTFGGPIEREDFPTHRAHYPHHTHDYGDDMPETESKADKRTEALASPNLLRDPNGDGSRGYIRVTPEIEAKVLAYKTRMPTASYAELESVTDIPKRTVEYILTGLPRLRRSKQGDEKAQASLKERIWAVIHEMGQPIRDITELRRILGQSDDEHNVVHVLYSLNKEGRIDFDERQGNGRTLLLNLRVAKRGRKESPTDIVNAGIPFAQPEPEPVAATAAEPEATAEAALHPASAPEPVREGYPLLADLIERERRREDGDSKGMAFITAAAAIEHIDSDMARELMAKAKAYDIPFPSPIEREYLTYVSNHPDTQEEAK